MNIKIYQYSTAPVNFNIGSDTFTLPENETLEFYTEESVTVSGVSIVSTTGADVWVSDSSLSLRHYEDVNDYFAWGLTLGCIFLTAGLLLRIIRIIKRPTSDL